MKRNWIIVGVVVIVVVIIAVTLGLRQMSSANAAATTTRAQTATVTRGNLIATVSAAGNVSAPTSTSLAFQTSGKVSKVNVQIGDQVKKGQLLMELDTTDLDLALKSAQTSLANQQASFDSTKANLQFSLRTAQDNLANSQSALATAQAKAAQNPNQLLAAKASLDKAQIALQKAQSDYNAVAWRPDIGMTSQAQTLQTATIDYNTALANYNVSASNIANDNSVKQAQLQLDRDQIALEQAQKNLDTTARTSQAQLDSAQISVQQAQRNLEKARIYAPYNGVVSAVNFNPNDTAGTGAAVVMADLSQLQVKLTIAEVDIAKIKTGQAVQLTLDALPGQTYTAKVLSVSPVGTVTQGVVNYPVYVTVTNSDGQVKPGMTANLAINVEERDNVLLLPLRAVRTTGNQKSVTVNYKGQSIAVPVQTGLTNDTNVEILSGLQEGDVVQLTTTTTRTTGGGGPGGFPGGGAIFRGD